MENRESAPKINKTRCPDTVHGNHALSDTCMISPSSPSCMEKLKMREPLIAAFTISILCDGLRNIPSSSVSLWGGLPFGKNHNFISLNSSKANSFKKQMTNMDRVEYYSSNAPIFTESSPTEVRSFSCRAFLPVCNLLADYWTHLRSIVTLPAASSHQLPWIICNFEARFSLDEFSGL